MHVCFFVLSSDAIGRICDGKNRSSNESYKMSKRFVLSKLIPNRKRPESNP